MEIITYVREGAITHEDSLGNRGRTEAGDVQVMSADTGIRHAEFNREAGPTTLFQINGVGLDARSLSDLRIAGCKLALRRPAPAAFCPIAAAMGR